MKNNKKDIIFITFAFVSDSTGGAGATACSIIRHLYNEGRLAKVFALGCDIKAIGIPRKYFTFPPFNFSGAYRLIWAALRRIKRLFPIKDRFYVELMFDFFCSRNKSLKNGNIILYHRPPFSCTAKAASKLGNINFGLGVILHPQFNADQTLKEIKKFGLPTSNEYVDHRRLKINTLHFATMDALLIFRNNLEWTFTKYGISRDKLIPFADTYGVDSSHFVPLSKNHAQSHPFRLIHVSHMTLLKGVGYLLEAWAKANIRNGELILVGDIDKDIRYLIRDFSLSNIRLIGPSNNILPLLHEADVFVSPSVSDNGPTTSLEAMAAGLPVIISNMCGHHSLVSNGIDGFIYRYDDVEMLSEHVTWCSNNRIELSKMGINARKKAMAYPRGKFAESILIAIDDHINNTN